MFHAQNDIETVSRALGDDWDVEELAYGSYMASSHKFPFVVLTARRDADGIMLESIKGRNRRFRRRKCCTFNISAIATAIRNTSK